MLAVAGLPDRHEVLDLADPIRGQEPRDQHVRVGEVQLARTRYITRRRELVVPTSVRIEDRGEHARGIEPRAAVPVDRPVRGDQRAAVQIPDQAVVSVGA